MQPAPDRHGVAGQQPSLRVAVIDDHPVVRMGLRQLIHDEGDLVVCGEAGTAEDALHLVDATSPDVAVVDLSLGESSGLELVKAIKASNASVPILVLSLHDERLFAERALRAGATGYIMKQADARELINAIRTVAAGNIYLSRDMTTRLISAATASARAAEASSPVERLTDREQEVFVLLSEGRSTREIADGLHLSPKTVETHRARIKQKLGLKSAAELLRFAINWQLR